jgi:hypothetical protein
MERLVRFRTVFSGPMVYWRGPSPFHFVALPEPQAAEIHFLAPAVSYGWGVIPVHGRIGGTDFTTALFPKDGGYLLPVRDQIRKAEGLAVGDVVTVALSIGG